MVSRSLRVRVLLGAVLWIGLALGAGGYAVVEVFKASALRQFDQSLEQELTLLSVAVATSPDDPARRMTSPAFSRAYSGLYWQASKGDETLTSRSLWNFRLDPAAGPGVQRDMADGPDGQELRVLSRELELPDGSRWQLAVAADLATLEAETALFQRGILPAAGWLALALVVAAVLVLRAALLPLRRLRETVREAATDDHAEITDRFPSEVAPLVEDLNAMLEKNTRLRARGRAQAANLAHALKTPAAVLQNEIDRVRDGGALDVGMAQEAVDRIGNAAQRHASVAGERSGDRPTGERHDAVPLLAALVRALERLFPDLSVTVEGPARFELAMEPADQQEIFGNLLENAGKWARGKARVTLTRREEVSTLVVEDDGAGVPEAERERILRQGVRLDETKAGAGLGLGIVEELVDRHDGTLTLGQSDLGGLLVRIDLPDPAGG